MISQPQVEAPVVSAERKRGWKHTWLHAPQQSRLRNALFQIHLWAGLILSLYVIVIGLSGSALVFREELQRKIEPHIYTVKPFSSSVSWQTMVASIRANNPGFRVVTVSLPSDPDRSAYVMLAPAKGKFDRSRIRMDYFNPYTGEILGEESIIEGPLGWIANLHYFLFAGEPGLVVNGIMAVGFLLLCVTGIVLWWPGIKRWASALILKKRSNWKRLNWDLHAVTGFWCSIGLGVLAFTGIYFAFPIPISLITILGIGGNPKQVVALLTPPQPSKQSGTYTLSIDDALEVARRALPADTYPAFVIPPAMPSGIYTVTGYRRNVAPYSQGTTLSIDAHSGDVLKRVDTSQYPLGMQLTQYFHAVHFGSFGGNGIFGIIAKVVWVFLGVGAAILGITGILMYWNRYLSKQWP